jgi:hypothetical protein
VYTVTPDTGVGIGVKSMRVSRLDEENGLVGEVEEEQGIDLEDAEATIVHRVFTPWSLPVEQSDSSDAGKANGRGTRALAVVRFKHKLRELGLVVFVVDLVGSTGRASPTQRWCSSTISQFTWTLDALCGS